MNENQTFQCIVKSAITTGSATKLVNASTMLQHKQSPAPIPDDEGIFLTSSYSDKMRRIVVERSILLLVSQVEVRSNARL